MCVVFPAGINSWVKNWKLNGWRLKSGGQITNKEDFMKLDRLNAQVEVVWVNISLCHAIVMLLLSYYDTIIMFSFREVSQSRRQ